MPRLLSCRFLFHYTVFSVETQRQTEMTHNKRGPGNRSSFVWCGGWDLNPHANAHAPQTCLSAYSSTAANSITNYSIQNGFVKRSAGEKAKTLSRAALGRERRGRRRQGREEGNTEGRRTNPARGPPPESQLLCFSSQLAAQPASTAAPRGRTPSLKTTLGLWEPPWW